MKATLDLTADEQYRAKRFAIYYDTTVDDLASQGLLILLQTWKPDLLINDATGEIIGDFALEDDSPDDLN